MSSSFIDSFMMEDEEDEDVEFAEDEEFGFETDLLNYDVDIDLIEAIRKQQNDEFLSQIEPISPETRLEAYPEMRMLKPTSKKELERMRARKKADQGEQGQTGTKIKAMTPSRPPLLMTVGDILKDKEMRKEEENPMQVAICTVCGHVFGTNVILQRHLKRHADGGVVPPPNYICPIRGCTMRCDCQSTLNEHVRIHHNRPDVIYKNFTFSTFQEFETWREELEHSSNSRFVHAYKRINQCGKSLGLSCFFSTKQLARMHPDLRQREKPSKKSESTCTAFMTVKETFGNVFVKACLVHCGHEVDSRRLPLSSVIRKQIAAALIEGVDETTIIENFNADYAPEDRRHHLQNYEVRNVLNKLIKNGFRPNNNEEVIKAVEEEEATPIIKEEPIEILEAPPFVAEEEVV